MESSLSGETIIRRAAKRNGGNLGGTVYADWRSHEPNPSIHEYLRSGSLVKSSGQFPVAFDGQKQWTDPGKADLSTVCVPR